MTLSGNSDETNGYNTVIKNGTIANANYVKAVICPIGTVNAWLKSYTNTPSLPDAWAECNGQTISDADSPYNGQALPNLNGSPTGSKYFLRGQITSGGTGGSDVHTHPFSGTTDTGNDSDRVDESVEGFFSTSSHTHTFSGTTNTGSNIPPYYEVVWIIRYK